MRAGSSDVRARSSHALRGEENSGLTIAARAMQRGQLVTVRSVFARAGSHTREWHGHGRCGDQDVSYELEVVPRGKL